MDSRLDGRLGDLPATRHSDRREESRASAGKAASGALGSGHGLALDVPAGSGGSLDVPAACYPTASTHPGRRSVAMGFDRLVPSLRRRWVYTQVHTARLGDICPEKGILERRHGAVHVWCSGRSPPRAFRRTSRFLTSLRCVRRRPAICCPECPYSLRPVGLGSLGSGHAGRRWMWPRGAGAA